jgi:hypothetical protein
MMKQQPDSLFREKLRNLEHPAPEGAWSRIEMAVEQKRGLPWMRVAAAVLLLALASASTWYVIQEPKPNQTLVKKGNNVLDDTNDSAITEPKPEEQDSAIRTPPEISQPKHLAQTSERTPMDRNTEPVTDHDDSEPYVLAEASPELQPAPIQDTHPLIPQDDPTPVMDADERITMVIEPNVSERYLKKTFDQATDDDKKSSGIRKLLDKASELKNDQDPFGDLRQMKNEVLALNFATARRIEQNK